MKLTKKSKNDQKHLTFGHFFHIILIGTFYLCDLFSRGKIKQKT